MPTLAKNKEAYFSYTILEEIEAGLVLSGQEVKSLRLGQVSMKGSYITFFDKKPMLINCHISPYKPAGPLPDYVPTRPRPILLTQKEIHRLQSKMDSEGLTIIPLSIYTKGTLLKLNVALARGKKKQDKRESIKKRETDRNIERLIKRKVR